MTFPIVLEQAGELFTASLVGAPEVRGAGASRQAAVSEIQDELRKRIESGQLLSIDVASDNVWGLAGRFANDPTLRDICAEAYAARDADRTP